MLFVYRVCRFNVTHELSLHWTLMNIPTYGLQKKRAFRAFKCASCWVHKKKAQRIYRKFNKILSIKSSKKLNCIWRPPSSSSLSIHIFKATTTTTKNSNTHKEKRFINNKSEHPPPLLFGSLAFQYLDHKKKESFDKRNKSFDFFLKIAQSSEKCS